MSCGQIAFKQLGIDVEQYDAWEIDKHAIQVTNHNFPNTVQHGDVFSTDFTQFKGRDWLVGGSPCTYWSIAQSPDRRETEASGIGWELFSQYVRCLREAQPKYFLYENNKSMAPAIRESITDTFGFEPICINSALVSAQNRNRLYWVGIRQEDGTYRKADIDQPTDRGILLKDVLDGVALSDKGHTVRASAGRTTPREYLIKNQSDMVAEPLSEKEMDYMVRTTSKNRNHFEFGQTCDSTKNKSPCVTTGMGRLPYNVVVEPIGTNGTKSKAIKAQYNKNALLNFVSDSVRFGATGVAEPINQSSEGKSQCLRATYFKDGMRNIIGNDVDKKTGVAESIPERIEVRGMKYELKDTSPDKNVCAHLNMPKHHDLLTRVYNTEGKSPTPVSNAGGNTEPKVFSSTMTVKSISPVPTYIVKDGMIEYKGKKYPIKLRDGEYIIRKLTVSECKRLQTVPDWYDMSAISNSQAYKCLGNGWTVEVIAHIIRGVMESV